MGSNNLQAVSKLANQWIDLFRAGDYTGEDKGSFSDADLDQIINNYDPDHYEAPSTFGHPKPNDSAPAYGWWSKLRRVGDLLQGQMGTVQPEFEEAVERGLYKKRSVGLVKRASGWALHHVAWLGAQAPHIKGLADVKFEQEDKSAIEIEFSEQEEQMADLKDTDKQAIADSVWERIKGLLPNSKTTDTPKTFSEDDVKRIALETATAAVTAAVAPLETKLAAQATQFSSREAVLATAETGARADAAIARVKTAKAWVPAFDKQGLPAVFAELAKVTETVEFGEGDAKVKQTPLEILTVFMEGLGQIVPTGRKVDGAAAAAARTDLPSNADANSVQFDEAIQARMKEKGESYAVAMDFVAKEHPELTRTGISTAGQV